MNIFSPICSPSTHKMFSCNFRITWEHVLATIYFLKSCTEGLSISINQKRHSIFTQKSMWTPNQHVWNWFLLFSCYCCFDNISGIQKNKIWRFDILQSCTACSSGHKIMAALMMTITAQRKLTHWYHNKDSSHWDLLDTRLWWFTSNITITIVVP